MKKFNFTFIGLILILSLLFVNVDAFASVSSLQKKKSIAQSNIIKDKAAIKEKTKAKDDVQGQIDALDKELTKVASDLNDTSVKLESVNENLIQSQKDLQLATDKKNQQQTILETRLRYMYEYGEMSYFETIISAKSFSDFLNRIDYIERIANYDKNMFTELEKTEKDISLKLIEINNQKTQIKILQEQEIEKKSSLQSDVDKKNKFMISLQSDIAANQKDLDQEKQSSDKIEKMIKDEIAKNQSTGKSNSNVTYTGGKLLWPVPNAHSISSPFGPRVDPYTHIHSVHTGIDIPTPVGSVVEAASSGTVIYSSRMSGYGNVVIIDIGGGISTLYAHNSVLLVKVGESVKRGQQITRSGNTGWSTGPHVHFEVRVNGVATNPIPYLK